MQSLIKFHQFFHKILSGNKIMTITRGHSSVIYLWKLMHNTPKLDLVNINAYAKFGLIQLITSQDIAKNRN